MTTNYLHGVEVIEIDEGPRPIRTVRTGVIGIVGTAPDSQQAAAASLVTGVAASNNALAWTAQTAGEAGNDIRIFLADPGANSAALSVSVVGTTITVNLATDGAGAISSIATDVIAAITASVPASALVAAANSGGSTGAGVLTASVKQQNLAGGLDEAFPLDTPVLIAGSRVEAAKLDTTNEGNGTLPAAMDGIFDQSGAVVVVVRVQEDATPANEISNVIGGVNGVTGKLEGVHALLAAESAVHVKPKILIAPGYTQEQSVVAELVGIAEQLKAVIVADGPNTTDAAAITYRQNFGSDRVYLVDPWVKVFDTASNAEAIEVSSARVAGLGAKTDNEKGFWWSWSNQEVNGIIGTARDIDWALSDANSRANLLNEQEVATIIRATGYRLWGDRSCSSDPRYAFLNVRRTADIIAESILAAHLWAVDQNITRNYYEAVIESVRQYMRTLRNLEAIVNGDIWVDPDLNNANEISQGHVYFDFDFTPYYPAERVTFRSHLTNKYLAEVLPLSLAA